VVRGIEAQGPAPFAGDELGGRADRGPASAGAGGGRDHGHGAQRSGHQRRHRQLHQAHRLGGDATASFSPGAGIKFAQAATPLQVSDASAGPGAAPAGPWGVWARGYALGAAAYHESGAGIVLGADKQVNDRLVLGFAANFDDDKARFASGGAKQVRNYQGAAYGHYAIDAHWYAAGLAGFGWQSFDSNRAIAPPFAGVATGSYSGQGYRAYGETGYALRPAFLAQYSVKVAPYAALGYLHTHSDSYTESGTPFALSVGAVDADSLTSDFGARVLRLAVFHDHDSSDAARRLAA
jgi:outer membrane autotransporter protein